MVDYSSKKTFEMNELYSKSPRYGSSNAGRLVEEANRNYGSNPAPIQPQMSTIKNNYSLVKPPTGKQDLLIRDF